MMKRLHTLLALATVLFLAGCLAPRDTVTQVSTIDALLATAYDGEVTCGELIKYGDVGIGTFDKLDGEMIVLDGKVYQFKSDGTVATPPSSLHTPFASVVRFKVDTTVPLPPGTDFKGLTKIIDKAIPNKNLFYAIRIWGVFSKIKTRSVPAQKRPYPDLVEVAKTQPIFNYESISGTIVGFRCPEYAKGINIPGYHLHFLADDLTAGGHILDFKSLGTLAEVDVCHRFTAILPKGDSDFANVDLSKDRSKELKKVEQ